MPLSGFHAWLCISAVVASTLGVACNKTNNVSQSTTSGVGDQCGTPDDPGCGVGAVCALGYCRLGCTTDSSCPQGAICVGDREPFGCSLPAEIACSSSQPCETDGLECGLDGVCRLPCETEKDCSRNEHRCIAGSCVGEGERDYSVWAACEVGATRCEGSSFQQCNVSAPGWIEASNCGDAVCTLPDGRCLEPVVGVPSGLLQLTVVDDALYWIDENAGSVRTSGIEPGSSSAPALELPADSSNENCRLNGRLLGLVNSPDNASTVAQMLRVNDGKVLIDSDTLFEGNGSSPPRLPMPSTAGLFWTEERMPGPGPGMRQVLLHRAIGGVTNTELGDVPASGLSGPYCVIGDSLYFLLLDGLLYRASDEALIEGPLTTQSASDIVCRTDDVLLATEAGLFSMATDGVTTPLIDHPLSRGTRLLLVGNDVLTVEAAANGRQGTVIAANLITGEVRKLFSLDGLNAEVVAVNESYVFVDQRMPANWQNPGGLAMAPPGGVAGGPIAPSTRLILRGEWK